MTQEESINFEDELNEICEEHKIDTGFYYNKVNGTIVYDPNNFKYIDIIYIERENRFLITNTRFNDSDISSTCLGIAYVKELMIALDILDEINRIARKYSK